MALSWPPPGPQQAHEISNTSYITNSAIAPSGGYVFRGSNTNTSTSTIGTMCAPNGVITKMDEVSMKDLQSDAFNTSVETLIDLWLTRYGNEWVDMDKIEGDDFYFLAYKRLNALGQLETHYLTDRARFVCRKPT